MKHQTLHQLAEQAGFDIIDGFISGPGLDGCCENELIRLLELLQTEKQQPSPNSIQPLDRYMVLYAEAEELLNRIHESHDDHYGSSPDDVTWGHVGSLGHFVEVLQYAAQALPGQKT
jgi:hypothetical protein